MTPLAPTAWVLISLVNGQFHYVDKIENRDACQKLALSKSDVCAEYEPGLPGYWLLYYSEERVKYNPNARIGGIVYWNQSKQQCEVIAHLFRADVLWTCAPYVPPVRHPEPSLY
jgi:hypothetical protein